MRVFNSIDTNNDGQIQVSEASIITYLNVSGTSSSFGGIVNMIGIVMIMYVMIN